MDCCNHRFFSPKSLAITLICATLIFCTDPAHAANYPPQTGGIIPASGSSAPGQRVIFTSTYSDPNSANDISLAHLLVNTSAVSQNCFAAYYDNKTNKLYMLDNNGVARGGFAPGSSKIITNSYCKLECSRTQVTKSGNTMTITWAVTFKRPFSGKMYNSYLKVTDKQNASTDWIKKGTWIVNFPPTVGALTPAKGSSKADQQVRISSRYSDRDKVDNINFAHILVSTSTSRQNCLAAYYDNSANKLYLLNDQATVSMGGFVPGSANIIENSYCKLDCSGTQVTKSHNALTIKWAVTFKNAFAGKTYNSYLMAVDKVGASTDWVKKGVWTVKATGPQLSVTVSPDYWNIGAVNVNSVSNMSELNKIIVTNGSNCNVNYSLCLVNPPGWSASQTSPSNDIYVLNSAFSSKSDTIVWDETKHALSALPVIAGSIKFAGDLTGANVTPGEKMPIWLQFKSPKTTSVTNEQDIEVIINAQAS